MLSKYNTGRNRDRCMAPVPWKCHAGAISMRNHLLQFEDIFARAVVKQAVRCGSVREAPEKAILLLQCKAFRHEA
jgi:hypothetical protein